MSDDDTVWVTLLIGTSSPRLLRYGMSARDYDRLLSWFRVGKERAFPFRGIEFPSDQKVEVMLSREHLLGIERSLP